MNLFFVRDKFSHVWCAGRVNFFIPLFVCTLLLPLPLLFFFFWASAMLLCIVPLSYSCLCNIFVVALSVQKTANSWSYEEDILWFIFTSYLPAIHIYGEDIDCVFANLAHSKCVKCNIVKYSTQVFLNDPRWVCKIINAAFYGCFVFQPRSQWFGN